MSRRGSASTGCLTTILAFVAILYVAVHIGEPYYRYLTFRDVVHQEARFATLRTNEMIKKTIWANADSLALPEGAYRVRITRTPRVIRIRTAYVDAWTIGPYTRQVPFAIDVQKPL